MKMAKLRYEVNSIHKQIKHYLRMKRAMEGKLDPISHDLAIMIKQIHAIEKGLAMETPRLGFGASRILKMLTCLEHYYALGGDMSVDECTMACSVLWSYLRFHDNAGWTGEEYSKTKERIKAFFPEDIGKGYGGTLTIHPNDLKLDKVAFEEIVNSRHSIRSFKRIPVKPDELRKALELAMRAPSACNRQAVRVYILDHTNFGIIKRWKGGAKTFIDKVDKLLIVTGQMAAYEYDEFYQYSISAGMFAGYLTLSLHVYGIGSCVLQRSLLGENAWSDIAKALNIPENEQPVCAIAIGIPNDKVNVPVSQRLSYDRIVKEIIDDDINHN